MYFYSLTQWSETETDCCDSIEEVEDTYLLVSTNKYTKDEFKGICEEAITSTGGSSYAVRKYLSENYNIVEPVKEASHEYAYDTCANKLVNKNVIR